MKSYKVPVPIGDRILVEVLIDQTKAVQSKIIEILESTTNDYNKRVLLSTTTGKVIDMGQVALEEGVLSGSENELMPGHHVLFLQNAGVSFQHADRTDIVYRLIKRGDIMAIVGIEE